MDEFRHRSPVHAQFDSATFNDLIHMLHDQCGVVSRILNDVLSLQKIDEGRLTLEMIPFLPERLVQTTIDLFQSSYAGRSQSVTVQIQSLDEFVSTNHSGVRSKRESEDGPACDTMIATETAEDLGGGLQDDARTIDVAHQWSNYSPANANSQSTPDGNQATSSEPLHRDQRRVMLIGGTALLCSGFKVACSFAVILCLISWADYYRLRQILTTFLSNGITLPSFSCSVEYFS